MSWTVDSLTYTTRKKLTVDQTKIDTADLTDFPCLVKLTSTNFDFSHANSDGFDIRFTASDGTTLLKYERERHDSANSLAEYWVKIPTVDYDADTDFYMYYRTDDTADGADPENVWDSSFVVVQHLADATTSTTLDSTANNNDGAKKAANEPNQVDGKIYKGQDFDGSDDRIQISANATLKPTSNITIEAWVNADAADGPIVHKAAYDNAWSSPYDNYSLHLGGSDSLKISSRICTSGGRTDFAGTTSISTGSWFHCAVTWNATDGITIYRNGAADGNTARNGTLNAVDTTVNIGKLNPGTGVNWSFNGKIDEVRISSSTRSAAWLKASYNSGNDSLLTYGAEESGGVTTVVKDIIGGFGIVAFPR